MTEPPKQQETRFRFGDNWQRFLHLVDDQRIKAAEASLHTMLEMDDLSGLRFLDIGSGSGLFSLAARNLGAEILSFDYDEQSVSCTRELKQRLRPDDAHWRIERGDALDADFMDGLGKFDIVYSWGVLHHTGDMWTGLQHAASRVEDGGKIFIAIYNDQRWRSRYWKKIKKFYNQGAISRWLVIGTHAPYFLVHHIAKFAVERGRKRRRGMAAWRDVIDWLGGYPFEVASPEQVFDFFKAKQFMLEKIVTVGGRLGCNQYIFRRPERLPDA